MADYITRHREDIDMNIFDVPMTYGGEEKTIGDFFRECLVQLWLENEGFSGKRPLGDSGWDWEIYEALAWAGLIGAEFDEFGEMESCDEQMANDLIFKALENLTLS